MKIGNGKSTGNNRFARKDFKLEDGDQVFRILPGIGDLADANRWSVHYGVHWGYKTTDGKKKPFASPERKNRETKLVEVRDAAKERIELLKAKLEEAKKTGNKAAFDKLNVLVGQKGLYNLDSNHFLNVIDLQGNIGVLKIRHKCKVALDAQIKKLESAGVYPLSPTDGRYFVFTRTGMGNETSFSVSVFQEELDVPGVGKVKRDATHSLTDEIVNRLANEAGKLDQLFPRYTSEQVEKIVETSDLMTGTSTYLDEVAGKGSTKTASDPETTASSNAGPGASSVEDPVAAQAAAQAATQKAATPATETTIAATTTVKVAAAKPAVATAAKVSVTDMSDADFLAALNSGAL